MAEKRNLSPAKNMPNPNTAGLEEIEIIPKPIIENNPATIRIFLGVILLEHAITIMMAIQ
jgi:hypothetical protein